ncbi:hypothetical protein MTR67_038996 [Solanum verrucosum]|uniref:Uncharacterized protein n=1 Tax=Solanum verrucosum TaxID=315347 RepID=A0AAF0UHH6_SOLVR|nr:hypothetical protein MTR67_038996 [Solanum verrucosum]
MPHRCFVLAFSTFIFWTIGRYSTTSRNYLVKRRLLLSSPFLSFSFRASHTGTKGGVNPFGGPMLEFQLRRSFQPLCSFLHLSVHAFTKTSNT